MQLKVLIFQLVLAFGVQKPAAAENEKLISIVKQWAPKVYLASNEVFFPGNVEDFLKQVTAECSGCKSVPGTKLPTGADSSKYFLTTAKDPDELLKTKSSFLYGTKATASVSAYADVKSCDSSFNHFVVTYWFFFPYNGGKQMCTLTEKIPLLDKLFPCKGNSTVVGDHVGDWENMALEIKNGAPTTLYLSVHDSGVFYAYDKKSNSFTFTSDKNEGILKVPNPPKTVKVEGGHPVLYSADGSHAVWGAVGSHQFSRVSLKELTDDTSSGLAWNTWQALKVFYSKETTPDWFYFQGKWGNAKSHCIAGAVCHYSDGPGGLSERPQELKC